MNESKLNSIKDIILGIVLLVIMGYISVWLLGILLDCIVNFIDRFNQVTSNIDAVVIVALITGSVSILGVVISSIVSKVIEYRQNTKRYLYEKREQPYVEFIEMVYKLQENVKKNRKYTEKEMLEDVFSFSKKLILWGSNDVIRKWLNFREISQIENRNPMDNIFMLEEIIFEIRKDMGQKKGGLKQGDILAFFVNDIKEHISTHKKK
ncbi:hypothetical protein [Dialister pneumosintes]|uniref:Uncharacterized protein n=1 Tax=Dialister pneumosintes TaxID=39950 RepID=A0A1B3WE42_9FIRM|nr:hypothetical protein [Dialister pneumosintes]AOH39185.1 hypothetical protein BCB69_03915 [Dialister pneumosintes]